jgi:hypothetical protein
MTLPDQDLSDEYIPLYVPSKYFKEDTQQDKIVFALSQLGEAMAADIIEKLEMLEPGIKTDQLIAMTNEVLTELYNKGLLKGHEIHGNMHYAIG